MHVEADGLYSFEDEWGPATAKLVNQAPESAAAKQIKQVAAYDLQCDGFSSQGANDILDGKSPENAADQMRQMAQLNDLTTNIMTPMSDISKPIIQSIGR